ncbi:hypothetical protein KL920_004619 [Ogataea angusta]|nr:hypothetical protein KL920_004619 [Ogataea angusta]
MFRITSLISSTSSIVWRYTRFGTYATKTIRPPTPEPTEKVPDVSTFLQKIGRGVSEYTETFENDWQKFWELGSSGMKEQGLEPRARKYILDWQERYRKGAELHEIPRGEKLHGGERKRRIYLAEKRLKEARELAQLKRKFKIQSNQEKRKRERIFIGAAKPRPSFVPSQDLSSKHKMARHGLISHMEWLGMDLLVYHCFYQGPPSDCSIARTRNRIDAASLRAVTSDLHLSC